MKRIKRENQARARSPALQREPRRPMPARGSRRWTLLGAALGLVALISGATYFLTYPKRQGTASKRQPAAIPPITLLAAAESNGPPGLAPGLAASESNWNGINARGQHDRAAADLTARANALLASGDVKGAIRMLEEALRLSPDDENLHYDLGIAYGRSGDITNAEHHYREALRLLPDYPEVHNNLGNLLLHAGRLSEAEAEFTEAIKSMPELASAHNNLGIVRQRQNRMPEAIACFREAVQYSTNYWQAHFNLAIASLSQGAKEEGRQELQTVLRLNPGYAPAQRALDKLQAQPPQK